MTATTLKRRNRRTTEQMIADLEAEIARVKAKAATKEVKASDDGKALLTAVKALDKATATATESGNKQMVQALERARAPLSELLVEMGLRMPAPRRRGRRKAG